MKALEIPAWLRENAVYQVNPRTFSPEGTIQALRDELVFLKSLGFGIVYLCPIFEEDASTDPTYWSVRQKASQTGNPKNPYRISNYFKIDSEYGTMDELYDLIAHAHALGMRVLLDLVYMHIAPNAAIIDRHPDFVMRDAQGNIKYTKYNFPFLNFEDLGLREYLWANMTYLVGELDADGFRCDVGDKVPDDFWVEGRRRIRTIKPDAVLINEGSEFWRMTTSFDSCYVFRWHEDLYRVLTGKMTLPMLTERECARQASLPEGGQLLRDMDNHDTVTDWGERIETLVGHDGMEMIQVLNYTAAGIPMVYCGNELADDTLINLFANRFYPSRFHATDRAALKQTPAGKRRQAVMSRLNQLLAEKDGMQSVHTEYIPTENSEVLAFYKRGADKDLLFVCNFGKQAAVLTGALVRGTVLLENKVTVAEDTLTVAPFGYRLLEL